MALLLRLPAIRDPRQRAAWVMLAPLEIGAALVGLVQQSGAVAFDRLMGVPHIHELVIGVIAMIDVGAVWWLALVLWSTSRPCPMWQRFLPITATSATVALTTLFFMETPEKDRFAEQAHGMWIGYAICWLAYSIVAVISSSALFLWGAVTVGSAVLRVSLLFLAVGTLTEVPFLVLRSIRSFTDGPHSVLTYLCNGCLNVRYAMIALGCTVTVLQKLVESAVYWRRRHRIYHLWVVVHASTCVSRQRVNYGRISDLATFDNNWARLHQRITEIRDGVEEMAEHHDATNLIGQAEMFAARAAPARQRRLIAAACWIAAASNARPCKPATARWQVRGWCAMGEELSDVEFLAKLNGALKSPLVRRFLRAGTDAESQDGLTATGASLSEGAAGG